jgi:hypothetical protein
LRDECKLRYWSHNIDQWQKHKQIKN